MLRAILYGFIGVLVDDSQVLREVLVRVALEENLEIDADSDRSVLKDWQDDHSGFRALLGASGIQPTESRVARLVARKATYYRETSRRSGIAVMPGVVKLLQQAEAEGLAQGVVTGAATDEVEAALAAQGIRSRFKVVVAADMLPTGQLDPASYLLAIGRLNSEPPHFDRLLHPHEILAIESNAVGVAAAAAAGLATVAVAGTRRTNQLAEADLVVPGLSDARLSELARVFNQKNRG